MRWFRALGPLFVPVSAMGWLVTALPLAFCIQVFLVLDARAHSVSDLAYALFPFWAPSFAVWMVIAMRTSGLRFED